jgi:hypothetical protein
MSFERENDIIRFPAMKYEIPIKIRVLNPMTGVTLKVQRGRDELLTPATDTETAIEFLFDITVDLSGVLPNFLGRYSQGPKDARFIYVNAGRRAGQKDTCWDRRAKISLASITRDQIEAVIKDRKECLQAEFPGVGSDGGPTCASVRGITWAVAER